MSPVAAAPLRPRVSSAGAFALGVAAVMILSAVANVIEAVSTVPALLHLVPIALVSASRGWRLGVPLAVAAAGVFAVFTLPPIGRVRIGLEQDGLVLLSFVGVAVMVSVVTDRSRTHRADALDDRRIALVRGLSHDLRSPLSTIKSASSELLADDVSHDQAVRRQLLGLVVAESNRMDRLVGNLLALSRVQAGELAPALEVVAVSDVISGVVERLSGRASGALSVYIDRGCPDVLADPVQLDQVLSNLLENALRHVGPAGTITIGARRAGPATVRFHVRDNGAGFSDAMVRSPIVAFRSASDSTGLGLVVAEAIVAAHGGALRLHNHLAGGAEVTFTMPSAAP